VYFQLEGEKGFMQFENLAYKKLQFATPVCLLSLNDDGVTFEIVVELEKGAGGGGTCCSVVG
jgi:hypothetical protein